MSPPRRTDWIRAATDAAFALSAIAARPSVMPTDRAAILAVVAAFAWLLARTGLR